MDIRRVIQPLSYLLCGDSRYYYYVKLAKHLGLSRESILELQNRKLQRLITHAYNAVPYYRRYFDSNNLRPEEIKSSSDLIKLPIMTKQAIKDNLEELKSSNHKKLKRITSGGSTGETAVVYKSGYFLQMSHAALLRNFSITGWLPWHRSVWIWGAPYEHQQVKDSLISKIGIFINGRLLLNAYNYSSRDFPVWAGKIKNFKPKVLYGYSSIILEFAKWCIENNITFDSIARVVSTTEKLIGRETIEKAFRCKVYDHYGCREVLSIATECKDGKLHISDDTVIVEHTDEDHLLITALDSFHFPIIRYKVGDVGKKPDGKCPCGLKFSLMNLEIGRITDNFVRPDNRKISSSAFATYLSTLNINFFKYQLIQKTVDSFEVKFVSNSEECGKDKQIFIKALEEYFGKVKVDFIQVEEIPAEPSGKRLLFKCLVKRS